MVGTYLLQPLNLIRLLQTIIVPHANSDNYFTKTKSKDKRFSLIPIKQIFISKT